MSSEQYTPVSLEKSNHSATVSDDDTVPCELSMSTMNTDPAELLLQGSSTFDISFSSFEASLDLDRHTASRTRTERTNEDSDLFGESFAIEDPAPPLNMQRRTSRGMVPVLDEETSQDGDDNDHDNNAECEKEQAMSRQVQASTAGQH